MNIFYRYPFIKYLCLFFFLSYLIDLGFKTYLSKRASQCPAMTITNKELASIATQYPNASKIEQERIALLSYELVKEKNILAEVDTYINDLTSKGQVAEVQIPCYGIGNVALPTSLAAITLSQIKNKDAEMALSHASTIQYALTENIKQFEQELTNILSKIEKKPGQ